MPEAIAKGAAAILVKDGTQVDVPQGVAVLTAAEPRRALALMAARFYPAQPATIVAVTGTSGKTSVADFARQIFAHLGHKAASSAPSAWSSPTAASTARSPRPIR